jgi:hypothetical protein
LAQRWHGALRELAVDLNWPVSGVVSDSSDGGLAGQDWMSSEDCENQGADEVEVEDFIVESLLFPVEDEV